MFQHLTDFQYQRTALQAFGLYLAYFFLTMVIGGLGGGLLGLVMDPDNPFELGLRVGAVVAVITCLTLSSLIIKHKKRTSFSSILLIVLSGGLALLGGALLGLVPVAYLSTRPSTISTNPSQPPAPKEASVQPAADTTSEY